MRHDTTADETRIFMSVYTGTLAKTGRTRGSMGDIGVVLGFRRPPVSGCPTNALRAM